MQSDKKNSIISNKMLGNYFKLSKRRKNLGPQFNNKKSFFYSILIF